MPRPYYAVQNRHGYIVGRYASHWRAVWHRRIVRGDILTIR